MSAGSELIVSGAALAIALAAAAVLIRRHGVRRPAVFVAGWFVIFLGFLMLPSPCPGAPFVVVAGLAILASEFEWARKPLHRLRERLDRFRRRGP